MPKISKTTWIAFAVGAVVLLYTLRGVEGFKGYKDSDTMGVLQIVGYVILIILALVGGGVMLPVMLSMQ